MSLVWLRLDAALLVVCALTACSPPESPAQPTELPCAIVGRDWDVEKLAALARSATGTLLVAGRNVIECPCGAPRSRDIHVEEERRQVRGADESRGVAGADEGRRVSGVDGGRLPEARSVKGADESRQVDGSEESRGVKGQDEARRSSGADEGRQARSASEAVAPPTCWEAPGCPGFRVSEPRVTDRYLGSQLVPASADCVRLH
jgi:hypothetical protein